MHHILNSRGSPTKISLKLEHSGKSRKIGPLTDFAKDGATADFKTALLANLYARRNSVGDFVWINHLDFLS
jgi:hypothetical protein